MLYAKKHKMAPIHSRIEKPPNSCLQNLTHSGVVLGGVSSLRPSRRRYSAALAFVSPCHTHTHTHTPCYMSTHTSLSDWSFTDAEPRHSNKLLCISPPTWVLTYSRGVLPTAQDRTVLLSSTAPKWQRQTSVYTKSHYITYSQSETGREGGSQWRQRCFADDHQRQHITDRRNDHNNNNNSSVCDIIIIIIERVVVSQTHASTLA